MCGIAGFSGLFSDDDALVLMQQMLKRIARRGPDGEGLKIMHNGYGSLCFGHRRLAIIDLACGSQPMVDERHELMVTFNGEIYNYNDLRNQLIIDGYHFNTRSDTEVLLYGFSHWGIEGLLNRIQGMFAFALFDSVAGILYLARDPFGQKPLFFSYSEGTEKFAFASNISALKELPWISQELDLESIRLGVILKHIPAPYSAYRKIKKVRPGHYLKYENGLLTENAYWHVPGENNHSEEKLSPRSLFQILVKSTAECLVSDVPVTLLLSSGLDSSLLACALAELGEAGKIGSVTVGFREDSFDESNHATQLAKKFKMQHQLLILEKSTVSEEIEEIFRLWDEPLGDPSLLPTMILSRAVSRITKVAISGDGGDELFAGYPTFQAIPLHRYLSPFPAVQLIDLLLALIPISHKRYSWNYRINRFRRGLGLPSKQAYLAWLFTGSANNLADVLSVSMEPYWEILSELVEKNSGASGVGLMCRQYLKLFLPQVLTKVDCASMHFGLEVRAPFLQPALSVAAMNLPDRQKINRFRTKWILRQIAIEHGLIEHAKLPKQGFNVPLSSWITKELRQFCQQVISENRLRDTAFFNSVAVSNLWEEHLAGRQDNFDLLWSIIATQKFLLNHG